MVNNKRLASVFKALGDENRIQIIRLLQGGEKCACRLLEALNITQPTLSHHMRILCSCGLVNARREGKWTYYSISGENTADAVRALTQLITSERDD